MWATRRFGWGTHFFNFYGVEVGVGREAEALLEVDAESTQRAVGGDGTASRWPSHWGSVNKVGSGLLQHVGD